MTTTNVGRESYGDVILPQAIVFAAIVLGGTGTFAIVAFSGLDWFLPALIYGCTVYVAWMKFYIRPECILDDASDEEEEYANERLQALERELLGKMDEVTAVKALTELEGRLFSGLGYVLGEASMKPGSSLEPIDRDRLEQAVSLCEKGYKILQNTGGAVEYMALNNLVYYSVILGEGTKHDALLAQARELIDVGLKHESANLMLTACRALLQFSSDQDEREEAMGILREIKEWDATTNREQKEAELLLDHFSQDPASGKRLVPNTGPAADA